MDDEIGPGLSETEAQCRLQAFGPNRLPDEQSHPLLHTIRDALTEPMFVLLLVAAALYLLVGDRLEGALLSGFAVLTVGMVVVQGLRRERALQALRDLAVPVVRVRRDARWVVCPAHKVVPGDWIMLSEGDRVAADAVLRRAVSLRVDEALLTGESWPVDKSAQGADAAAAVWAGTLVVAGHGVAEVVATGARTRLGAIGGALAGIVVTATPLQRQIRRLVRLFGALAAAAMLAVLLWWGWARREWLQGALSALSLGMGMLPEEFPMALAVFMSMGAWRLSRLHVLARRPEAVEALGTTTMLCVDKTGTLTQNALRLVALQHREAVGLWHLADQPIGCSTEDQALLRVAARASRRSAVDPLDRAVDEALARCGLQASDVQAELIRDWPVQAERAMAARAWRASDGRIDLVAKGAPECVARHCLDAEEDLARYLASAAALAAQGYRVLAAARAPEGLEELPADEEILPPVRWAWQGLLVFEDPLRPTVPAAVEQARQAGIGVCLITGDHVQTALAIARQAGIDTQAGAMEGSTFESLPAAQQVDAIGSCRVFARVTPLQKLALVRAFQRAGHVVAMTGDGVNDAPALKAAHIGVAMGRRGTDVAREASGLVLMREDFSHLVQAIEQGRAVFENLRRVSGYIVAIHVPLVGLAVLPLLIGWPPLMAPAHVVMTEMLIDPMCTFAFEAVPPRRGLMQEPPRPASQGLLPAGSLWRAVLLGTVLLGVVMAIAAWHTAQPGVTADGVRTVALVTLMAGNLCLVALQLGASAFARRGPGTAARTYGVVALLVSLMWGLGLGLPWAREVLQLEVVSWGDQLMAGLLAAAALFAVQCWLKR